MIAGALTTAVVLFGLVVSFIVPSGSWFELPGAAGLALPVVVGVAAAGAIATVGHNVPAIPQATPAETATARGVAGFRSSFFIRLAFAEVPALVGLAAVFIAETPSMIPYLIGGAVSLVLLGLYVFPTRASVQRIERKLDRDGGRSRLAEAFGFRSVPGAGYTGSATVH